MALLHINTICMWFCCCSVAKSCPTICNPTKCSTPGSPILHYLPVCSDSCPLSQQCHPSISSSAALFSFCLQSFPTSGSFPMSWLFTAGGQSIGASALASVLPMNTQPWFTLGLTGLISLQSKGLSPQFENISSSVLSLLYGPTVTSILDYWKNHFTL